MVCIAVKGMPSIGVIHKPFESKQTYWAWTNHGSSSNLHTLSAVNIIYIFSSILGQLIINYMKMFF